MANSIQLALQNNTSSVVNSVRLTLNNHVNSGKIIMVVEGPSDKFFFKRFYSSERIEIIPTGKCSEVVNVIQTLQIYRKRLVGVKDADFDRLNGISYSFDNLFMTEGHDLEIMILASSKVFDYLNVEYLLSPKVTSFTKNKIYRDLLPLSMLRWYNSKYSLRIKFDKINPGSCCIQGQFNFTQYERLLFSYGNNNAKRPDKSHFRKWCRVFRAPYSEITTGHDAIKVLYQYVRNIYKRNISEKVFQKNIITAYPKEAFEQTKLAINMAQWVEKNYGTSF